MTGFFSWAVQLKASADHVLHDAAEPIHLGEQGAAIGLTWAAALGPPEEIVPRRQKVAHRAIEGFAAIGVRI
jgi:hypothetical protein